VELGAGFACVAQHGSEHRDELSRLLLSEYVENALAQFNAVI
jgi:chorismate synthase